MGGVVDLGPGAAWLDAGRAGNRIDPDSLHQREVEHESIVDRGETGPVVATAANRQRHVGVAGEVDGGNHVGDIPCTAIRAGFLSIMAL